MRQIAILLKRHFAGFAPLLRKWIVSIAGTCNICQAGAWTRGRRRLVRMARVARVARRARTSRPRQENTVAEQKAVWQQSSIGYARSTYCRIYRRDCPHGRRAAGAWACIGAAVTLRTGEKKHGLQAHLLPGDRFFSKEIWNIASRWNGAERLVGSYSCQ